MELTPHIGYVSVDATDVPMQYAPGKLSLPAAFAVSWSQFNGVFHVDLHQNWIKPIAPGESVGESLSLDRIHRRKLLPGASDTHAVCSEK